jgi:hypothetical protein
MKNTSFGQNNRMGASCGWSCGRTLNGCSAKAEEAEEEETDEEEERERE